MTETPQTPDPSITASAAVDAQTGPAEKPAKKATSKRAAKKAAPAAPAPETAERKDSRSLYLPALPDGFEYTGITATGPNGETINIAPAGGDAAAGSATLAFEGANLNREQTYADMPSAIRAGAKAARAMADVAKREAELARLREEAFDL